MRPWVARLILFLGVLLLGHAVGVIIRYFVRLSLLTGVDRFLGLLFGLLRGVLDRRRRRDRLSDRAPGQ